MPPGRVKPSELAPTVRVMVARRGADHQAGVAGHVPFAGFLIREAMVCASSSLTYSAATSRVGTEKVTSWSRKTSASSSSRHRHGVVAHAFLERADAGAGHDLVVVALGDVLFGPRLPSVSYQPGFGLSAQVSRPMFHASSNTAPALRSTVPSEWMPSSAWARVRPGPRAQLTDGDDDDFVLRAGGDVLPIGKRPGLLGDDWGGQSLESTACGVRPPWTSPSIAQPSQAEQLPSRRRPWPPHAGP